MRQSQDYGATPILADALEDAGCDDAVLLASLRGSLDWMTAQRLVATVYSNESEMAVREIGHLADEFSPVALCEEGDGYDDPQPFTYERLMRAADRFMDKDSHGWGWYTTEHGGEYIQDAFPYRQFWPLYALVTGRPTADMSDRFFSCTC